MVKDIQASVVEHGTKVMMGLIVAMMVWVMKETFSISNRLAILESTTAKSEEFNKRIFEIEKLIIVEHRDDN